jgi:hypothetical protein
MKLAINNSLLPADDEVLGELLCHTENGVSETQVVIISRLLTGIRAAESLFSHVLTIPYVLRNCHDRLISTHKHLVSHEMWLICRSTSSSKAMARRDKTTFHFLVEPGKRRRQQIPAVEFVRPAQNPKALILLRPKPG